MRAESYFVEESLWELLEALRAHKALLVVKLPVAVHDLLRRGKAALAALAHGVGQSVGHVAGREETEQSRIGIGERLHEQKSPEIETEPNAAPLPPTIELHTVDPLNQL